MRRKKKYATKLTAEEYEKLTGQRIGSLVNQGISNVVNVNTERTIINVSG